jgi:hypothetical protein
MVRLIKGRDKEEYICKRKIMENYWSWVEALATAWGFMLLVALLCCCLSTKPRQDGDVISGNGGCTCDGGGHGCV